MQPLTPPECDLQDFEFMPVMVRRLLKSDTWALGTGDERAAAIALWFESWHQVPAASLPGDERLLARLADTPKWNKVKEQALRGWVKCDDGRLYHPVVAEKALEAWMEKLLNSISGASGNAKRWQVAIDTTEDVHRLRVAADLLRALEPKSKALRKKAVLNILVGSPPDSGEISPPDPPPRSPPDSPPTSGGDRKGEGEGEGQGSISPPSGGDAPRKRSSTPSCTVECPEDVAEQTWTDWLTLRRKKSAPVTETVLRGARREAEQARMPLDAFLQVWCTRGSQGLQADWLKPQERQVQSRVSFAAADQQRAEQRASEWMGRPRRSNPIDVTPGDPALELLP